MKTERPYPFVTIDARGTKRAQEGHPWVFDNEITAQEGTPEDGALCDVRSPKGRYLGTGYYNSHSIDGGCFALFFAVFRSIYLSCVAVFLHSLHRFQVA